MTASINLNDVLERCRGVVIPGGAGDDDLVAALGMSREHLAACMDNNEIPFDEIVNFCTRRHISMTWVFLGIWDYGVPQCMRVMSPRAAKLMAG